MTPECLAEIITRFNDCDAEPWTTAMLPGAAGLARVVRGADGHVVAVMGTAGAESVERNAAFVAMAPAAVRELLTELDRLKYALHQAQKRATIAEITAQQALQSRTVH